MFSSRKVGLLLLRALPTLDAGLDSLLMCLGCNCSHPCKLPKNESQLSLSCAAGVWGSSVLSFPGVGTAGQRVGWEGGRDLLCPHGPCQGLCHSRDPSLILSEIVPFPWPQLRFISRLCDAVPLVFGLLQQG